MPKTLQYLIKANGYAGTTGQSFLVAMPRTRLVGIKAGL